MKNRIEENRRQAERGISQLVSERRTAHDRQQALLLIGALAAVNQIGTMLNAQTIRGLQRIRDEKLYFALGFERFDDFLNNYEYAPLSYRQFNDRERLLKTEGEALFDVLNALKLSHRERRLLGEGRVQLEGEKIIVTLAQDNSQVSAQIANSNDESPAEETVEINVGDRARMLQTLSALADQAARQAARIERDDRHINHLERELETARRRAASAASGFSVSSSNSSTNPSDQPSSTTAGGDVHSPASSAHHPTHFEHYLRAASALEALAEYVKKSLPASERARHGGQYLRILDAAFAQVQAAYNLPREDGGDAESSHEFSGVLQRLNDEELAGMI